MFVQEECVVNIPKENKDYDNENYHMEKKIKKSVKNKLLMLKKIMFNKLRSNCLNIQQRIKRELTNHVN